MHLYLNEELVSKNSDYFRIKKKISLRFPALALNPICQHQARNSLLITNSPASAALSQWLQKAL